MVVVIVGASVAGASLAYCLAKRGIEVVVYDKARFPRAKACGEGLLPPGIAALHDMGLEPTGFPSASGLRFVAPSGEAAEADFPGGPGLIVRRELFDAWLVQEARAAGAEIREGTAAPADIDADVLVAADGLHSRYADGQPDTPRRIGFSTHATRQASGINTGGRVEVRFHQDGELYLAPGDLVAALMRVERFRAIDGDAFSHLLGRPLETTTPVHSMCPLGLFVREVVRGHRLMIGDAAGAPDPITGEGMSLALRSALVASEAIAQDRLDQYAHWRREQGDAVRRFGRILLSLGRFADAMVPRLARRPEVFAQLIDAAVGRARLGHVPLRNWLRLLAA